MDDDNHDRLQQRHQEQDDDDASEEEASDDEFSLEEEDLVLMETSTAQATVEAEQKLKDCQKAHQRRVQIASLKLNARLAWHHLSRNIGKTHVPTILFCLKQEAGKIPDCMHWKDFDRAFPNTVRSNREVMLARLESQARGFDEMYEDKAFPVPKALRGDEEVMLVFCRKSPQTLAKATKELQNNAKFVLAAIVADPAAFEHASARLHKDRKTVRSVLSLESGIRAYPFLSKKLRYDPGLAILAIQKAGEEYANSNEHLLDLPEEYRDDHEVVWEAVQRRGSNLRHATEALKTDIEYIDAACQNEVGALLFVPDCPARKEMLKTKEDLILFLSAGAGQCMEYAPDALQDDRDFVLLAVENGYASERLGRFYQEDKSFFLQLIASSNNIDDLYASLPSHLQGCQDVVQAVIRSQKDTLSNKTMTEINRQAEILTKRDILTAVRKGCLDFLGTDLMDDAMTDKSVVLDLCRVNGESLKFAGSASLKCDMECLQAALQSPKPIPVHQLLRCVPQGHTVWENAEFLEAVIGWAQGKDSTTQSSIDKRIPQAMYSQRKVYLAMIKTGWPQRRLPWRSYENHFRDDQELALAKLKYNKENEDKHWYCRPRYRYEFLGHSWSLLRRVRSFLEQAVLVDPGVLHYTRFKTDFDLHLLAIAPSRESLMRFEHFGSSMKKLSGFGQQLRSKMQVTEAYVLHFLGPMSIQPPPPKKRGRKKRGQQPSTICHLPSLALGGECGSYIKRLIAEYADIPVGPKYKLMRDASEHMAYFGY